MKAVMAGGVIAMGVAMAVSGGVSLGSLGAKPFHYESASSEERAVWLEKQASAIAKPMRAALVSPSGVGGSFSLKSTEVSAGRRQIKFVIRVQGKLRPGALSQIKVAMLKKTCPRFVKSAIAKNDVRLVQAFVNMKKQPIGSITVSNSACRSYV